MTLKITSDNIATTTLNTLGGGIKISSVTYSGGATAANPAGGETITLTGSGFNSGITVYVDTTSCTTTYVSSTSCTFTSPAKSVGTYHLYVYNTDGGMGMKPGGFISSSLPTWVTSSGALPSVGISTAYSQTVVATGDGTITYSVTSGSLPTGLSLNSNTGVISGTTNSTTATYNFTITASDSQNQTASRSFSITVTSAPSSVTYLLIAGGGAGAYYGAGGGAGGLLTGTQSVSAGTTYNIVIGAGGVSANQGAGVPGNDSTAFGLTAYAGGGGSQNAGNQPGGNGGSGGGGGAGGYAGGKGVYPGSTYISATRQGYDGGTGGGGGNYHGAGGGGAGGQGADGGNGSAGAPGDGGLGYQSSITGTALYYAGGGGGSGFSGTQGTGGSGVGGTGYSTTVGGPGATNTGSGGAGGGYSGGYLAGGNGGSGVLILSYPNTYPPAASTTGSPTITNVGGNRIYQFNSSGSITF